MFTTQRTDMGRVLATLALLLCLTLRGTEGVSFRALSQKHEQYSTRALLLKFEKSSAERNAALLARANSHERRLIQRATRQAQSGTSFSSSLLGKGGGGGGESGDPAYVSRVHASFR